MPMPIWCNLILNPKTNAKTKIENKPICTNPSFHYLALGFLAPRLKTSTGGFLFAIIGLDTPGAGLSFLELGVDTEELGPGLALPVDLDTDREGGDEEVWLGRVEVGLDVGLLESGREDVACVVDR